MRRRLCLLGLLVLAACGGGDEGRCGDRKVGGSEACDDGNDVAGDGCEADCTFSCQTAADCDDGESCTTDACDAAHACTHAPATGATCEADGDPATPHVCADGACAPSSCGDGIVDLRTETCDDANGMPSDGCEDDCRGTPTAFRVVTVRFADPHTWTFGLSGCEDNGANFDAELQASVDSFELNIVLVFRPLDPAAESSPVDIVFGADCTASACQLASGEVTPIVVHGKTTGTCFEADASTLNPDYTPGPNSPDAPCFASDPQDLIVPIGPARVPFQDAIAAGTFSGDPPTMVVSGLFAGFVSEADAKAVEPAPGFSLYSFLAAGQAQGSSCATVDDRDTYMTARGFWFYLDLTAAPVDWSDSL